MMASPAVSLGLLFGVLLFLALRRPGVLVYDFIARRLRRQRPGPPSRDLGAHKPARRPEQARQAG